MTPAPSPLAAAVLLLLSTVCVAPTLAAATAAAASPSDRHAAALQKLILSGADAGAVRAHLASDSALAAHQVLAASNQTALMVAAHRGACDVVRLLLEETAPSAQGLHRAMSDGSHRGTALGFALSGLEHSAGLAAAAATAAAAEAAGDAWERHGCAAQLLLAAGAEAGSGGGGGGGSGGGGGGGDARGRSPAFLAAQLRQRGVLVDAVRLLGSGGDKQKSARRLLKKGLRLLFEDTAAKGPFGTRSPLHAVVDVSALYTKVCTALHRAENAAPAALPALHRHLRDDLGIGGLDAAAPAAALCVGAGGGGPLWAAVERATAVLVDELFDALEARVWGAEEEEEEEEGAGSCADGRRLPRAQVKLTPFLQRRIGSVLREAAFVSGAAAAAEGETLRALIARRVWRVTGSACAAAPDAAACVPSEEAPDAAADEEATAAPEAGTPIATVDAADLTAERFRVEFYETRTPVLVKGAVRQARWACLAWSVDTFADAASPPAKWNLSVSAIPYPAQYGLRAPRTMTAKEYVGAHCSGGGDGEGPREYAFENHLHLRLGESLDGLFKPWTQLIQQPRNPPQFSLGGTGTGAPPHLHQDALNGVCFGSKKWHLWHPRVSFLSIAPAAQHFGRGGGDGAPAATIECVQEAGDLLFVPHAWGHAVLNLEPTLAVAQEYYRPFL